MVEVVHHRQGKEVAEAVAFWKEAWLGSCQEVRQRGVVRLEVEVVVPS